MRSLSISCCKELICERSGAIRYYRDRSTCSEKNLHFLKNKSEPVRDIRLYTRNVALEGSKSSSEKRLCRIICRPHRKLFSAQAATWFYKRSHEKLLGKLQECGARKVSTNYPSRDRGKGINFSK
jgi:hypothetical protein